MDRKVDTRLRLWKDKPDRLPLVIFGARQVGKTYSLLEFARSSFENYIYVSLEVDEFIVREINRDLRPASILSALSAYRETVIVPGKTLIILDEVQNCERALTALKYFAEEMPALHIVAAGSLLGVAVSRQKYSFPVGKVELLHLFPLDFEEYLWALGHKTLGTQIREVYSQRSAFPEFLHDQLLRIYQEYLLVGGMPAVVLGRLKGLPQPEIRSLAVNIITQYLADMSKYCGSTESVKIRMAYDSIPAQLAKENTKFQYKLVKNGASGSYFGSAIDWLKASGTILICRRISQGYFPPSSYMDLSAFKLYMSDVGLYTARVDATIESLQPGARQAGGFRGGLAENYVAQALQANQYELFYWESEGTAEVDFVIAREGQAIPIEVKAADNTKSKSLNSFISKYQPPYAIRLSTKNFGWTDQVWTLPLYAAHLL